MKPFQFAFILIATCSWTLIAREMQVAVSVRHLQIEGRSYHHLFLYDQNGNLVRQLTDAKADDLNPRFDDQGDTITFERRFSNESSFFEYSLKNHTERSLGKKLPDGYPSASPVGFEYLYAGQEWGTPDPSMPKMRFMSSPDQSVDLIIPREYEEDHYNDQTAYLRDRKTRKLTPLRSLPGYEGFQGITTCNHSPFLFQPPLKTLFFSVHRGSTDGNSFYALDLAKERIVQISYNGCSIIPVPHIPGFFCITQERYQPLGDGRTVNCDYLDWWDENLKRIRFSTPLSRFGGASVFRPPHHPIQLPIQDS